MLKTVRKQLKVIKGYNSLAWIQFVWFEFWNCYMLVLAIVTGSWLLLPLVMRCYYRGIEVCFFCKKKSCVVAFDNCIACESVITIFSRLVALLWSRLDNLCKFYAFEFRFENLYLLIQCFNALMHDFCPCCLWCVF